ncbi:MAG TPA: ribosome biogenesis GTPase Der [Candidatus Xenobia bacterium]|jgi:GTP-binding protein
MTTKAKARAPLVGELDRPVGVVAIVGRPNVGKSALFNRLTHTQQSIVEAEPGVTRDRVYGECEWNGRIFTLVDTGGMVPDDEDKMTAAILTQARRAIEEADVVLFVVDVTCGIMPHDDDVASIIRQSKRSFMLVANKVDNVTREAEMGEFYRLGLGDPWPVSALHGLGTGEILDEVVGRLNELKPVQKEEVPESDVYDPEEAVHEGWEGSIRVAIVGRPNVGKSSLTNLIVGDSRSIVDDAPGTTRDSLDTPLLVEDQRYIVIDTAGLRRPARVDEGVEFYSNVRSIRALRRCDVALLMLDGHEGISAQDARVAGEIHKERKACIIIVNKWDLVGKKGLGGPKEEEFRQKVAAEFDFLAWAPVVFISTKEEWGTETLFPTVKDAWSQYTHRIDTPKLNRYIQDIMAQRPPPTYKGKQLKVFYAFQEKVRPPVICLRVNSLTLMHFSYRRYLENRLREAFGFKATPVILEMRKK